MATASRKYLESVGINVPEFACRMHTKCGKIWFYIQHYTLSDWRGKQCKEWIIEWKSADLTETQVAALRRVGNYGSFGWELQ